MEEFKTKIGDLVKKHYDQANCDNSILELYEKTGLAELINTFVDEIAWEHITQYSKQFPKLDSDNAIKFIEEIQEIISSNMSDDVPIVNEVENIVSWAEGDVDNFMAGIDNYVGRVDPELPPQEKSGIDGVPDYNTSVSKALEDDPLDDLDDLTSDQPEEEKSTPIKWGENDW